MVHFFSEPYGVGIATRKGVEDNNYCSRPTVPSRHGETKAAKSDPYILAGYSHKLHFVVTHFHALASYP